MSAVLETPARVPARTTAADLFRRLGDVPPDRVRTDPPIGTATLADLVAANAAHQPVCELIDGTLVEKAMGQFESWLAALIIGRFDRYLEANDIGMLYAPDGVLEILPGLGRAADVTFVAWASLPGGRPPAQDDRVPAVVPDLAVEVLSWNNTRAEMTRKRGEYFRAGTKLVWQIDPIARTATVYTADDAGTPVPADGVLDGADVLPGFVLSLPELFARADRRT